MNFCFFVDESDKPEDFTYSQSFIEYVSGNVPDLEPWSFLDFSEIKSIPKGLKERYPKRLLVPFARRVDNDDVACFDASKSLIEPKIIIIHDFATPGWEKRGELENFKNWLELVEEDIKEWEKE
jgi:hypothetical protein